MVIVVTLVAPQIEELTESVEQVQAKLPPALRQPVPPVPTLDDDELPEK